MKLLTEGKRNLLTNAAYLNFDSADVASKALEILRSKKFDNRNLHVAFVKEQPGESELHGKTSTLMIDSLPPTITEDQIKSLFPSCMKVKILTRSNRTICFVDFESNEDALSAFNAKKDAVLGQSKVIFVSLYFRFL